MIKSIFSVVVSFLSLQGLISQNYIPLAVEGAHWVIRYDKMETTQPVDDLWEYHSTGDTIINDINYLIVYKRNLVVTQDGPPFEAEGPYQLYGLVREDTANRKVYAIKFNGFDECPENEEYLLYDFLLNIGDTLDLCIFPDWSDFVIEDIYSKEVLGFNTRVYFDGDEIYEGMGSNYGLFEEMFAPIKKTGNHSYVYHTFLDYYCRDFPCGLFVYVPEQLALESITLSPNPAEDYINISTAGKLTSILMYNYLGQEVINCSGDTRKINVSKLPSGLYIIELKTKKNTVIKKVYIE